MKKLFFLLIALLLYMFMVSGCTENKPTKAAEPSDSDEKSTIDLNNRSEFIKLAEEQLHLVFITPLIDNPVWQGARDGFDAAAKEFDFRGDWVGPTAIDVDEMIKQIEIAIAEKADGIITQGTKPDAMLPVLEKAEKAGIPVVIVNSDAPNAPRLAYLGTDPKNFGKIGAEAILEQMGNTPIKVAYMTAALDYKIGLEMVESYEEVLKTAPGGYEYLTTAEDKANLLNSIQQFENIFNVYPECNLVVSVTGSGGVAAAKVVQEKGLTGKVTIMAIDDISQTLDGIRYASIYGTMTQNFYRAGYQASQWICEYVRSGKKPPHLINDSGTVAVTKKNIDTYKSDMRDPASWK